MDSLRVLKRPAVEAMTGLSRSGLYAKMSDGSFPSAIKLGPRSVGWIQSEVITWIEGRVAASRGGI